MNSISPNTDFAKGQIQKFQDVGATLQRFDPFLPIVGIG